MKKLYLLVFVYSLTCFAGELQEHQETTLFYYRNKDFVNTMKNVEKWLALQPDNNLSKRIWGQCLDVLVEGKVKKNRQLRKKLDSLFLSGINAYIDDRYQQAAIIFSNYSRFEGSDENTAYLQQLAQLRARVHRSADQVGKDHPAYSQYREYHEALLSARRQDALLIAVKYAVKILDLLPFNAFAISNLIDYKEAFSRNKTMVLLPADMIFDKGTEYQKSGKKLPGFREPRSYAYGFFYVLYKHFPFYKPEAVAASLTNCDFGYDQIISSEERQRGNGLITRGSILIMQSNYSEGIASLEKGLTIYPNNLFARYTLNKHRLQLKYTLNSDRKTLKKGLLSDSLMRIEKYRKED